MNNGVEIAWGSEGVKEDYQDNCNSTIKNIFLKIKKE